MRRAKTPAEVIKPSILSKDIFTEAIMSFFTAYLNEIKTRKEQKLSAKPIETSELMKEIIEH